MIEVDKVNKEEKEEKDKIFVVFHQQRWDEVDLIKGFKNKEKAEKLRKELEEKETNYDDIYCLEEIEIEDTNKIKIEFKREEKGDFSIVFEPKTVEATLLLNELEKRIDEEIYGKLGKWDGNKFIIHLT